MARREKSKCMTDQKLIEHWIQGCAVQRIMFRDGLVLNLADYNELVISTPITLTLPAIATRLLRSFRSTPTTQPSTSDRCSIFRGRRARMSPGMTPETCTWNSRTDIRSTWRPTTM
jgi:hypothetical protein